MTLSVCPYCSSMYFSEWRESEVTPLVYFNKCQECEKWSRHNAETKEQDELPESNQRSVTGL